MKNLICIFLILVYTNVSGQKLVRVYNSDNKRIATGEVLGVNDSGMKMMNFDKVHYIPIASVDHLLPNAGLGENIGSGLLIGGLLGLGAGFLIYEIGYDSTNVVGDVIFGGGGMLLGASAGLLTGLVVSVVNDVRRVKINGNPERECLAE